MIKKIYVTARTLGLCATLALFSAAGLCYGQNADASLSGTVTDTTNAAIPGAALTLTNEATGLNRTAKADSSGEYNITTISPGRYDLTVSASGFATTINKGIQLTISQTGRVDVHLQVGQAHQTVTVTAGASAINFTNATVTGLASTSIILTPAAANPTASATALWADSTNSNAIRYGNTGCVVTTPAATVTNGLLIYSGVAGQVTSGGASSATAATLP